MSCRIASQWMSGSQLSHNLDEYNVEKWKHYTPFNNYSQKRKLAHTVFCSISQPHPSCFAPARFLCLKAYTFWENIFWAFIYASCGHCLRLCSMSELNLPGILKFWVKNDMTPFKSSSLKNVSMASVKFRWGSRNWFWMRRCILNCREKVRQVELSRNCLL